MPMLFQTFAEPLDALEPLTGRLQMVAMLADTLAQADADEVAPLIYLTQGLLAPEFRQNEFGVNERLAWRAIAQVSGATPTEIEQAFKRLGDLGLVAQEYSPANPERAQMQLPLGDTTATNPTVIEVHQALSGIADAVGAGSQERKIALLADLLRGLSPLSAKHVARILVGRLRVGVGDPTLLEALSRAKAGDKSLRPALERAYNRSSDLGLVATTLYRDGVEAVDSIELQVGNPVRMALAERADSVEEIITRLGRCSVEPKYDGFRCQVHKNGDEVMIFSRGLENMTGMFPEIADAVRTQIAADQAIFEGEALAYDPATDKYLPFQETTKRRRVHKIEEMSASLPLKLAAFDLLLRDGEDLTRESYEERRRQLCEILQAGPVLQVTEALFTEDAEEMALFFVDSVGEGLEGIVAKKLSGPYQAGKRDFNWIKLKRSYQEKALLDTVDVVVVGYYYGRGRRASWGIGSLLCAVYDRATDTFPTVTRCASGLSDAGWIELGQRLGADRIDHKDPRVVALLKPDVWVVPRYVFELQADEVSRSPMHPAGGDNGPGYALRFPRIIREREKQPTDATSVAEVLDLYRMQGHKGSTAERGGRQSKKNQTEEEG
jgi:DNA ligase-1